MPREEGHRNIETPDGRFGSRPRSRWSHPLPFGFNASGTWKNQPGIALPADFVVSNAVASAELGRDPPPCRGASARVQSPRRRWRSFLRHGAGNHSAAMFDERINETTPLHEALPFRKARRTGVRDLQRDQQPAGPGRGHHLRPAIQVPRPLLGDGCSRSGRRSISEKSQGEGEGEGHPEIGPSSFPSCKIGPSADVDARCAVETALPLVATRHSSRSPPHRRVGPTAVSGPTSGPT